jgi:transposase
MDGIDPNDIIVIDESGADLSMTSDYARAEGGARARAPKPHLSGNRYSIIGAIGVMSIIASMYVEASVNTEIFLAFVAQLLLPKLKRGNYVVMDNVSFHKNHAIISLIESTGAKVVFLPPYSPDLSPIEKMWSKIKEIIKRLKPRSSAEFHDALAAALHAVNEDDFRGWYEECGYAVAA